MKVENIMDIAITICQMYLEKDHLYNDLGANYGAAFIPETSDTLREFENRLLNQRIAEEELSRWKSVLEGLIEILGDDKTINQFSSATYENPLFDMVEEKIECLQIGVVNQVNVLLALPRSVLVCQLRACITQK